MKPTLLETIAQRRTNDVVYTAISLTIEKIATEVSRDILREQDFKEELKAIARQSIGRAFRDLRQKPIARRAAKWRGRK